MLGSILALWGCAPAVPSSLHSLGTAASAAPAMRLDVADDIAAQSVLANSPPTDTTAAGALAWQAAPLPDHWRQSRSGRGGVAWYRFTYERGQASGQPLGVLLPKLSMNADVWWNGTLVGREGSMEEPLTRHWNTPLAFALPAEAGAAGHHVFHVRVKARADHDGGLAALHLGPWRDVQAAQAGYAFWRTQLPAVCIAAGIVLGSFFLLLWLRERSNRSWGYFGAGAVVMSLANLNFVLSRVPVSDEAWEFFAHASMLLGLMLVALFGLAFANRLPRWLERAAWIAAGIACIVFFIESVPWALQLRALIFLPVLMFAALALVRVLQFVRSRPLIDHLVIGVTCLFFVAFGTWDWMIKAGLLPLKPYMLPFAMPLMLAPLAWLVAGDFTTTRREIRRFNDDLSHRLAQREHELATSFESLAQAQREVAVAHERSRILRDMHDGAGAHLATAIRQIEAGKVDPTAVADTLRDALDQLKLSIDAINAPPGDVNALLASLRYRLTPRITGAGLELVWQVEQLPPWPQGANDVAMKHLQFILFETLSNALQHAQASRLTLDARASEGGPICIQFSDNGRGLNASLPESALRSIRERAAALGAKLEVEGGPGGLTVRIELPTQAS